MSKNKTKDDESKELDDKVKEFLNQGGVIETVGVSQSGDSFYMRNRKQRNASNYFAKTQHNMFVKQKIDE
tara:strand:- start:81 stop:290 length:210 start_codon:yes stop_codon:yes gene_type:complete